MSFRDLDLNKIDFIVPELISYLKEYGMIDEEGLRYFPERYPVKHDDFSVNFSFLNWLDKSGREGRYFSDNGWPTERCYLNIDGERIITTTISGQGCVEFLTHFNDLEDKSIYKQEFEVVKSFEELIFDWPDYIRYEIEENEKMERLFKDPEIKNLMKDLVKDLRKKKK